MIRFGVLGNVAIINFEEKFALAQRAIALKVFKGYVPNFLKYVLMSNPVRYDIFKKATGTTALGIKSKRLKEVIIPLPPYQEQKRVVKKLDGMMDLFNKLEKRIDEFSEISEQLLDTTVYHAFVDVS